MTCRFLTMMLTLALFVSCSDLSSIKSPQKSIRKTGDFVFAEGRWKALPGTKPSIKAKINFTSHICDHTLMTCRELEALLLTKEEQPELKNAVLYNQEFGYKITNWNSDVINAKREAPVADVEIIISLRDGFAEKSFRETKARGSETANPAIYGKWVLE